MEQEPLPPEKWKIISAIDVARGVGEVILHTVLDQFRYPSPSEHHVPEDKDGRE